eukprot:366105-Pyramimonas_sp.AAC.1
MLIISYPDQADAPPDICSKASEHANGGACAGHSCHDRLRCHHVYAYATPWVLQVRAMLCACDVSW